MKVTNLIILSSLLGAAAAGQKEGKGKKLNGTARRGSKSNKVETVELEVGKHVRASSSWGYGNFNDGVYKGAEEAEKIWQDNGSDCGVSLILVHHMSSDFREVNLILTLSLLCLS